MDKDVRARLRANYLKQQAEAQNKGYFTHELGLDQLTSERGIFDRLTENIVQGIEEKASAVKEKVSEFGHYNSTKSVSHSPTPELSPQELNHYRNELANFKPQAAPVEPAPAKTETPQPSQSRGFEPER